MTSRCRSLAAALLVGSLALGHGAAAAAIDDDFEVDAPGAFPGGGWGDVRLVALPNSPLPSALVVETTDASGAPTHALQTVDAVAASRGALQLVTGTPRQELSADVRVDRFGAVDPAATNVSAWPLLFGVAQVLPGSDLCCFPTPQVGILVSTLTQGFRLYAVDGAGNASDIDLGLAAAAGAWMHVALDVDSTTGSVRSRITDPVQNKLLVDRTDQIPGWSPTTFDALAFYGGELDPEDGAGQGSLDNVHWAAVPEPGALTLLGVGLAGLSLLRRRVD